VNAASSIRPATASDAAGIALVHVQAWREAYTHLLSADFLEAISVDQRTAMWSGILNSERPDRTIHVAEQSEQIVGFAFAGPARDADAPREVELYAIYLLAAQHGSGLAQGLIEATLGQRPASLWIAEDNPRARRFYTRNGFEADGARKADPIGDASISEIRLVR
jgi:GNAT superfamily N-acetyltransferase